MTTFWDGGLRRLTRSALLLAAFVPEMASALPNTAAPAAGASIASLASWSMTTARSAERTTGIPSMRPVESFRYTSAFGIRSDPFVHSVSMHPGVDLAAPSGTEVHATADGVVLRAAPVGGYGNLVEIGHGADIVTRYGHLSRILVHAGERVRRGDVVALVGSTGRSTGSHLHYEVRVAGRPIDPLPYMAAGDDRLALNQAVGPVPADAIGFGGPALDDDR